MSFEPATSPAGPSSSSQSGGGSGELASELAARLTVRVEDLDLPVVLTAESAELRYSPREYLETF